MKITIKNIEKRYGVKVKSVMNYKLGRPMWMIVYNGKELYFENKKALKEFLENAKNER